MGETLDELWERIWRKKSPELDEQAAQDVWDETWEDRQPDEEDDE